MGDGSGTLDENKTPPLTSSVLFTAGTPTNAKYEHLIRVVERVYDCSAMLILQKIGLGSSTA